MTPRREQWIKIAIALSIGFAIYIVAASMPAPVHCALYQGNQCVLDANGNMARLK